MHNRALHDSLAAFVQEAAWQLAEEVSAGAEVPFELDSTPTRSAPLYCYRPQTGRFIAQRIGMLGRLPSYAAAAQALDALPDLPAYLRRRNRRVSGDIRDCALQAFLGAVWDETADFVFDEARFDAAYGELEDAVYADCELSVVLAPIDGLVLSSDEVPLGDGMSLVRATTLAAAPAGVADDPHGTVAILALENRVGQGGDALETAGRRLRRLQTALRLWDDCEPALGPTAWARSDGSSWMPVPLATGPRRPAVDCLLGIDEEDPLRAFCSLVSRRTPRAGELAWALRRFELGCERATALEALTDWLLAARALFADSGFDGVAERIAAICAEAHDRERLEQRIGEAIALERAAMGGRLLPTDELDELVSELGGCLRAVLRDVLCGHLDPSLRRVADSLREVEQPA